MKHKLFWRLFPGVVALMLLAACGGGGGGGTPPPATSNCVWDSSNWDSGCTWGS